MATFRCVGTTLTNEVCIQNFRNLGKLLTIRAEFFVVTSAF